MQSKVEEVKKIHENFEAEWDKLRDSLPDCSARMEFEYKKLKKKFYMQICQLFEPKPNVFHRPAVQTFATAMEHRLRDNDHKGGWGVGQCSEEYLNDRLVEELGEYFAIKNDKRASQDLDELVDIANFAMMIYQRRLNTNDRYHK